MRHFLAALFAGLGFASLGFADAAYGQRGVDGLRDPLAPEPVVIAPPSYWTPSALRDALLDAPVSGGTLPRGFAVRRIESRRPSTTERAAGMSYRIDVILNGPYPAQTLSYRIYETVAAAFAASDDKTLADGAVTLTSESLAAPMLIALPGGRAGRCARVRSAAYEQMVFMRCYSAYLGLPVIVSGSVGAEDATLTDLEGHVDLVKLDLEKATPAEMLRGGIVRLDAMVAADPDGVRAYTRDNMQNAATTPAPH